MTEGIPPGGVIDDADTWDLPSLLRVRGKRPRSRSAAEQRDERASPHGSPLVGGGPEHSSRDLAAVIPAASRQATRKARAP
jgi:hypothetical protein